MSGASFMRAKDGQVVESWEHFGTGGMLMQLAIMPADTGDMGSPLSPDPPRTGCTS